MLSWLQPEHLSLKKEIINYELWKKGMNYIVKMETAMSPYEKLDCLQDCINTVQNTFTFYSGKTENGLDDFLPYFEYFIILSQPRRLISVLRFDFKQLHRNYDPS